MQGKTLKVASYNVNGIHSPIKRGKILSKLKKEKIQIAFLQETHLSDIEHDKLNKMGFKYIYSSSHKSGRRRGVAVLISGQVKYEHVSEIRDKEGRFVLVTGKINGALITLLNVYIPPGSDWLFYKKIFEMMTTKSQGTLICGGDFNIRLNPRLDSSNKKSDLKAISKKVNALMKEVGIIDVWRELYPSGRDFTHFSSPHAVYSRLDYFFTFGKDFHRIRQCNIGPITLSDHSPIYMSIHLDNEPRSLPWRLNSNLLNNSQIKEKIRKEIKIYLELNDNGEVTPSVLWDALKAVLRGKIIAISSYEKKLRKERLINLEEKLKELQRDHVETLNKETRLKMNKIQKEIDEISTLEIQKMLLFTKQRYYEAGGKSLKLLSYRLRKQQADNSIYKIRNPYSGNIETKTERIQQSFEMYFKSLYSQPRMNNDFQIESFLATLNLPTITNEQNDKLLSEIKIEELNAVISKLKTGKSPGADGFTSEWYRTMKEALAPVLLRTFNWVLKKKEIPASWRHAIISVLPKDGKDKLECSNYRPISILNIDYKLFTTVLSKRIENILPELIHLDQTGFVKQRQTQDNIRRTLHIIDRIIEQGIETAIISLDAEKAFDSVRWSFLYKVLEKFGFHKSIIEVFEALYDKPSAKIKINGHLSNPFILERGTRQGCCASPLLFSLFIEPLAQWIRQNTDIKGINMPSGENKLALFADDVLIYLSQPTQSLPKLMNLLEQYGLYSGYKLNIQKTQVITFNYNPPNHIRSKYKMKWDAESIRYLGVNLTKDITKLFDSNYNPLNSQLKSDISRWNVIPFLSLGSRVESIKMNILPRLLYLFQNLPVSIPTKQFIEWDVMISRYLWQGKKPRIKFKTLQLSKESGGMGLPSLREYYLAAQLRPLVCLCTPAYSARWKEVEIELLEGIPIEATIADNELLNKQLNIGNPWLNILLRTWQETAKTCNLNDSIKLLRWCAYDTEFIPNRSDGKFKKWAAKGLTNYFSFTKEGTFHSFEYLKKRYNLEQKDFYRYLQVRNYFNQNLRPNLGKIETGILKILLLASESPCTKIISKLYKAILHHKSGNTWYIKEKWEREGNLTITEDAWKRMCLMQWTSSCSTIWREFCWKNVIRFFITPLQKRYGGGGSSCWRQCGTDNANHFHVFWNCPVIVPYWQEIHKHINNVFGVNIPFTIDAIYMGDIQFDGWRNNDKKLVQILLAGSKKLITRNWLKPHLPTIDEWIDMIYEIYVTERLSYSLKVQKDRFYIIWSKWTEYIKPIRMDFS